MKKTLLLAISLAAVSIFPSCGGPDKLAADLAGSWSGAPEHLFDSSVASATILQTYDFSKSAEFTGGDVVGSSLLNITTQASGTETGSTPYSVSMSGIATIEGTWKVDSDDEIVFDWDPGTLFIRVDPEAVEVSVSPSGVASAHTDSMQASLASALEQQIRQSVSAKMMIRKLEDVKIKQGEILEYEISDRDYVMRRQGK